MIARNIGIKLTAFVVVICALSGTGAWAQTPVATYRFANALNAEENAAPALSATDPLGLSSFGTAQVFGQTMSVYNFAGSRSLSEQAGLTLNTANLISPADYSIEMVFKFTQNAGNWRRIIDVENRRSDDGFYVSRDNTLQVYPESGAVDSFALDTYYHIVMTVGDNQVKAYQNGQLALTVDTTLMNINNANNPNGLMNFFLDNTAGNGLQEYSNGSVALIRAYNSTLTGSQVTDKFNQVSGVAVVPEAGTVGLLGAALLPIAGTVLRRRVTKN
jgi:hypothetical protein